MTPTLAAREDPALTARVVRTIPLLYEEGADPALDRPAHVRAGSGVAWIGARLVVVQDDSAFLALVDPATGCARAVTLPDEAGVRQFDDVRGNKHLKADLEACAAVPDGAGGTLFLAFGSGSGPRRERILVARGLDTDAPDLDLVDASPLYARLRETRDFSGSDMNIEGAALVDGVIRLFGRGNGAARDGFEPVDATCDLSLDALLAYLRDPSSAPPPSVENVIRYELGEMDGLRLGFTDAARIGGVLFFTASAEDSPDATRDGRVAGSALGIIDADDVRWTALVDVDGAPFMGKVEGLAPWPTHPGRLWVVVDHDAPALPSELCEVVLAGSWGL